MDDPLDDPGLVEFSSELVPVEPVLFDLLFLSFEELGELEFILELGEDELGLVVSEGVLLPGVDDILPGVDELGEDVLGEDVLGDDELPEPGVPGAVL